MSDLLIIGGTGFFGKSILDAFQRGVLAPHGIAKIIVAARGVQDFAINYPELMDSRIELVSLDISNGVELPVADIVIHAASSTDARDYQADPNGQRLNIEQATLNYCGLAKKYHRSAKIIYCSSGAVYGQQPENIAAMAEDSPFQDVDGLVAHKRDYALGKRYAERQIQALGSDGLNVSIARCYAFYGQYLPRDQHFAYGNFIGAAERGEAIEVKATHAVVRSYMHADDLVLALIQIALEANSTCPIYNVGSGEAIEIRDLAKQIGRDYGVPVKSVAISDDAVCDRYVPDVTKLSRLILGQIRQ